ncbi:MAG TPA: MFS transporter [Dongiaceae bacterium]|jgi:predicted MFS family arabinose efflux permease|nr:MFS transporter [Dongiaceae bacterium]
MDGSVDETTLTSADGTAISRPEPRTEMTAGLTFLFALAVGVLVMCLSASQALVGEIGPNLGLSTAASSLVTTLTFLGYAAGLFLLVPLVDVVENRRLTFLTLTLCVVSLGGAALAPEAVSFLALSFAVGASSTAVQMLVPTAAFLTPEASRGRVVGNIMSGIMLGLLIGRPLASVTTELYGWRTYYGLSAILVALIACALARVLPQRKPEFRQRYGALIRSLLQLVRNEPVLRRRATYQALLMGSFSMFWTSIALRLGQQPYNLGHNGIALFALAGAAGAIVAPIAGRAGDRGLTRRVTFIGHGAVIGAILLAGAVAGGSWSFGIALSPTMSLALLVVTALMLDAGAIADQAVGRRAVNLLRPEARGRINGLFTGVFFLGGSAGALCAGPAWAWGGWPAVCWVGLAFAGAAMLLHLTERRS